MQESVNAGTGIDDAPELSSRGLLIAVLFMLAGIGAFAASAKLFFGADENTLDSPEAIEAQGVDLDKVEELLENEAALIGSGSITSALALGDKLKKSNPEQPWAHLLLGHARFLSGRRTEAMESYKKALSMKPELKSNLRMIEHVEEGLMWDDIRSEAASMLSSLFGRQGLEILAEHANSDSADAEEQRAARDALIGAGHEEMVDWSACLKADPAESKVCKKPGQDRSGAASAKEVAP